MPKACEQVVDYLLKAFGKFDKLSPASTEFAKYLTSQVFFMPRFRTYIARADGGFSQPNCRATHLLSGFLPPYSTLPITKTIK
jgi:hypothetical protein